MSRCLRLRLTSFGGNRWLSRRLSFLNGSPLEAQLLLGGGLRYRRSSGGSRLKSGSRHGFPILALVLFEIAVLGVFVLRRLSAVVVIVSVFSLILFQPVVVIEKILPILDHIRPGLGVKTCVLVGELAGEIRGVFLLLRLFCLFLLLSLLGLLVLRLLNLGLEEAGRPLQVLQHRSSLLLAVYFINRIHGHNFFNGSRPPCRRPI